MIRLRDYQIEAVSRLRKAYQAGARRLLLVASVGSGKTVIAAHLVQSAHSKARRVLFVAHRWELLDQPARLLRDCGLRVGIIKAGVRPDLDAPVQVASIQTLARRALPPADLVIVDEAHRAVTASYRCLDAYPAHLGLTATPWRLDGRGLGERFHDLIEVATTPDLVRDGWLIDPIVYAPHVPELPTGASKEYTAAQLSSAMDRNELVGDIVEHWKRIAPGRRTVCYAATIDHSRHIVARFAAAGIAAEHVDGNTPPDERAAILDRLRTGETLIVSNVDIITEGYDLPSLSCAILARPTVSLTKALQMIGRIMRPTAGKSDAIVLDHAACTIRHGLPSEPRVWSLEGREQRRADSGVRVCSYCFAVSRAKVRCDQCGEAFPVEHRTNTIKRERRGDLIRAAARAKAARTSEADKVRIFHELRAVGQRKNYKPGWAYWQFRLKFGEGPPR
jgi:superfamily II DNA or RNA helicase